MKANKDEKSAFGIYQIVMLVLCFYVLLALLVSTILTLPAEISNLIEHFDTLICFVFIFDFFRSLYRAESKIQYLKWGWIDLISSIPSVHIFRIGRLFRVVRIIRVLRGVRSIKILLSIVFINRAKGAFASVVLITFLLMIFSSMAILNFETSEDANITTAEEALWWSFVTVTTVGYGDYYPISLEGRILAGLLMMAGIGLFGTFTAFATSWFLGKKPAEEKIYVSVLKEIKEIKQILAAKGAQK